MAVTFRVVRSSSSKKCLLDISLKRVFSFFRRFGSIRDYKKYNGLFTAKRRIYVSQVVSNWSILAGMGGASIPFFCMVEF